MSNKTEKLKEVIAFVEANKDKSERYITEQLQKNGIISRRTYLNWKKEGLLNSSIQTTIPTAESGGANGGANGAGNGATSVSPVETQIDRDTTKDIIKDIFHEHEIEELKKKQNNKCLNCRKKVIKENEELKTDNEELKEMINKLRSEKEIVVEENRDLRKKLDALQIENHRLLYGNGSYLVDEPEQEETIEEPEQEIELGYNDEDEDELWKNIKKNTNMESVFNMKKESFDPNDIDLNTMFDSWQKDLEVHGTHKKMRATFESDDRLMAANSKLNIDKILDE